MRRGVAERPQSAQTVGSSVGAALSAGAADRPPPAPAPAPHADGSDPSMTSRPSPAPAPRRRTGPMALLGHILRGFLIGITELVPGVSGSTIALILGVYTRLIRSAGSVTSALKRIVVGPERMEGAKSELRAVEWSLIIPLVIGMGLAVVILAGPIHDLVEGFPLSALGLFFGIVLLGIAAPLRLIEWDRKPGAVHVVVFLVAAAAAFLLTGLATDGQTEDPSLIFVFFAAALAICALVIPGVSGSFILLALGLYAPTLQAVDSFDLPYIGVFAAGAAVGLLSFVRILLFALDRAPVYTLVAMAGLMAGSLRALWPWNSGSGPYDAGDIVGPIIWAVVGAVFVLAMMMIEERLRVSSPDDDRD